MLPDGGCDARNVLQRLQNKLADSDEHITSLKFLVQQLALYEQPDWFSVIDTAQVVTATVDVMTLHPHRASLQNYCLVVLYRCMQVHKANINVFISNANAIVAIVNAMESHQSCVPVQINACLAIGCLRQDILSLPQKTIRSLMRAMLKALHTHGQDISLSEAGIQSMKLLCSELDQNLSDEGIKTVVKIMRFHPNDLRVQSAGCSMLMRYSSKGDDNVACMNREGALGAILAGMRLLVCGDVCKRALSPEEAHAVSALMSDPLTLTVLCLSVCNMYEHPSCVREERDLTLLTHVLIGSMGEPSTVAQALNAMISATDKVPKNREILGAQAIQAVLSALHTHKNHRHVCNNGRGALVCLTRDVREHAMCLANRQAMQTLAPSAEYINEEIVQKQIFLLFSVMLHAGGAHVIDAMRLLPDDSVGKFLFFSFVKECNSFMTSISSRNVAACDSKDAQKTGISQTFGTDTHDVKHVKVRKVADVCVACGKSAAEVGTTRLLACSGCTIAPKYCGAECQKASWGAHKAECKANRKK
jgi:hypothetical protein